MVAEQQILSGMRVKIGDLGGTITFSEAGTGTVGSNSYRAPEVTMGTDIIVGVLTITQHI